MTRFLVTGATGHLGGLTIDALLARGVAAADISALVRDRSKGEALAERGIDLRVGSYDDPASLAAAMAGIDRVLLVSGSVIGDRVAQHRNVVQAAAGAGVSLLAYTSMLRADTSTMALMTEHRETEEVLASSELPTVVLRNGWYMENYTDQLPVQLEHGSLLGAAGDGRVSAATRADFAAAAAAVLVEDGHAGEVYELGGDEAFALADYAAELTAQSGTEIAYVDLPTADYAQALAEAGVDPGFAQALASSDEGLKAGELFTDSTDLSRLIGRPTTSLAEALAAALAARAEAATVA